MECSLVPIPHVCMSCGKCLIYYTKHILYSVIVSYFTLHIVSYVILNINVKSKK